MFFLKKYLTEYKFILESDCTNVQNEIFIYFLYDNNIWFTNDKNIKDFVKSSSISLGLDQYCRLLLSDNIDEWIRGKFIKKKYF